jgi:gliding motility-associated protein GldC
MLKNYLKNLNTNLKKMANNNTSEIKIQILLDENRIPEKLSWAAVEGGVELEEAKAVILSVWNSDEKSTKSIELWTKDMAIDDMKIFFHQTLLSMTETFQKATGDEKMSATMQDFCDYFAEKLELKL